MTGPSVDRLADRTRGTGEAGANGARPITIGSEFAPAPPEIGAPSLSLPTSGGAIRGIGEKFAANPATGTGSMTVPIAASPGRSGFGPALALAYDSGRGNSVFGFGWSLALPAVTRRTDKGLPRYDETDVFLISDAEDLVPALAETGPGGGWEPVTAVDPPYAPGYRIGRYRPRTEGLFARIERWTRLADGDTFWQSTTRDNVVHRYGQDANSRVADPADPSRVFSWLLCHSEDGRGNAISYEYLSENSDGVDTAQAHERARTSQSRAANRYPKRIRYGNRVSLLADPDPPDPGWMFEVVFDYGDHDPDRPTPAADLPLPCRSDPFSSYRAGFEVRAYRLCRRVLMFHHFRTEEGVGADCLVRSTDLKHTSVGAAGQFLASVTQRGYRRAGAGYLSRSMPPVEFGYTAAGLTAEVRELDADSLANLPAGLDAAAHQWADLDGEGIAGVLVTDAAAWYYKPNLGYGRLGALQPVPGMPSPALDQPARPRLLDLAGDGQLDVVTFSGPSAGYLSRTTDDSWLPWRPFSSLPTVDLDAPDVRLVDLNGDGHADLLVAEGETLTWYPSLAEAGFGAGITLPARLDEESAPVLIFADGARSVHLADMSGDGLADLVRIGNGEVCYWPNLGYGRFGAKVVMDDPPLFDRDEVFEPRNLRLADVDGSGVSDLLYLAADGVWVHFNRSGNGFAAPELLPGLPPGDSADAVDAVDLLGSGTTCLVWSSGHADDAGRSMRYADLMGGVKPHLLERVVNNLGAQTVIRYTPSTRFYLADRAAGRPWLTRLPFPVQVVERVETYDRISRNRFVTRFAYHHGYFDGIDREFRGFGMTEQWDTEELSALGKVDLDTSSNVDLISHIPPVLTRTWMHTGAFLDVATGDLAAAYAAEYWQEPGLTDAERTATAPLPCGLPETLLLADGTRLPHRPDTEELREAYRALRGATLRCEVYALDGSAEQDRPYTVGMNSYVVELLQPMASQPHAVCVRRPQEAVTVAYERRLYDVEAPDGTVTGGSDPRVGHEVTLDTDGFGNVLRGVSLVYPRRFPGAEVDPRLPGWAVDAVTDAQSAPAVVLTTNRFTNAVDEPAAWRSPAPAESHAEELIGVTAPSAMLRPGELRALADGADPDARRTITRSRIAYRGDDLAGPLPIGVLEARGIPYGSWSLALTDGLVDAIYRRDGAALLPDAVAVLGAECGYLHDGGEWWAPSGTAEFGPGAVERFCLPDGVTDPFGNTTMITYDPYALAPADVTDPLGKVTAAVHDYRVLAPRLLTDPNGNRSEVAFDALGLVAGTARRGKPDEAVGATLDGFEPDVDEATVAAYFADPLGAAAPLLTGASSRVLYDLFAYDRTKDDAQPRPAVAATLARETYDGNLAHGQATRIQQVLAYSDGFGREVQRKARVVAGPLVPGGPVADPRWAGTGWTIMNNKGLPVRQYEPFFSTGPGFEVAEVGVSPILCYDPVGRVVATVNPDRSWAKVSFDAWRQESWDTVDTALVADPRTDADVGDHLARLPVDDVLPTWYAGRAGGGLGADEQMAAERSAELAGTPAQAYLDPIGRPVLAVAHNRVPGTADDELQATHVVLDVEGNQQAIVDALGRTAMRYDHDLAGQVLHSASQDAGERWLLGDVVGKPRYGWDSRGFRHRTTYDALSRPVESYRQTGAEPETTVGRTEYGESLDHAEAVMRNLLGRPHRVSDGAGVLTTSGYDFAGNPLGVERRMTGDSTVVPDWSGEVPLEAEAFATESAYDALDRPTLTTAPDGSRVRPTYDEAGVLSSVDVTLGSGPDDWQPYVSGISYTAKGQRESISYGNGAVTEYGYDPFTQRLRSLRTVRTGEVLQDLAYAYDPAGNIVRIADAAQQRVFFRNALVEPSADYRYDATYRLVEATGREHLGQLGGPVPPDPYDTGFVGLDQPGDGMAMGRYTETYAHDAVGNILTVRHVGSDAAHPGWTRTYSYGAGNRLDSTTVGSGPVEPYTYDEHGSMTSMPHLPLMRWDHADRLQATAQQVMSAGVPETTWYSYDGGGQRARWVTLRSAAPGKEPTRKCERIYLGGLEVYREYTGAGTQVTLERTSLSVLDGQRRIALVERRTLGHDGSPELLVRYQFGNHLGSASLELDADGRIISYEEFSPYGATSYQAVDKAIRAATKRYRFTGMERDEETGLEYHSARYYVPWLSRWTAADPAMAGNPYAYCSDRPCCLVDSNGLIPTFPNPHLAAATALLNNAVDNALMASGALAQFASDMSLVPSLVEMAIGSPLSLVPSRSFQEGRDAGRDAATVVGAGEMVAGAMLFTAGAAVEASGAGGGMTLGGVMGGPVGGSGGGVLGGVAALPIAGTLIAGGGLLGVHGASVAGLNYVNGPARSAPPNAALAETTGSHGIPDGGGGGGTRPRGPAPVGEPGFDEVAVSVKSHVDSQGVTHQRIVVRDESELERMSNILMAPDEWVIRDKVAPTGEWYRTPDDLMELEYERRGHANTDEGPHLKLQQRPDVESSWTPIEKVFIEHWESFKYDWLGARRTGPVKLNELK
jgi:RHS repeat-associated protein